MRLDDPIISGSITFITGGLADFASASVINLDLAENSETNIIAADSITGSFSDDSTQITIPATIVSGTFDETLIVIPAVSLSGSLGPDTSVITASYSQTASFAQNLAPGASIDSASVATIAETASILSNDSDYYVQFQNTGSDINLHFYTEGDLNMMLSQSGELHVDGDIIGFSNSVNSDENLKENIVVIQNALDKLHQINGVEFDWKESKKHSSGVIAQNIQQVLPHSVKQINKLNDNSPHLTVDYNSIIGLLIEAVKELDNKISQR